MPDQLLAQFLSILSQTSGQPQYALNGIINFKLPTRPYPINATDADKEKYDAYMKNVQFGEQALNSGVNQGLNTQLNLFTNPQEIKTNPYYVGDNISQGVLNTVASLPGPQGTIGKILNAGNKLLSQNVKENPRGLNNLSQISGFTGAQAGQGQNLTQIGQFNNSGFLGQLFTKKSNRKASLKNQQNQWISLGNKAKNLSRLSRRQTENMLGIDALGQQATLTESGFPQHITFGKKGLIFMEKNPDVEFLKRQRRKDLIQKINDIYSLNKSLMSKIENVRKILEQKTPSFREGGAMNLIVDGQLHAQKHQLKTVQMFEEAPITQKGVPVITMSEGGDIDQQQEVERDELILHFDLTKQMEQLAKDGSEEQMVEAGKILAKEIVKNTKDNKNKLLKTIE